jgi:hypothetical protein
VFVLDSCLSGLAGVESKGPTDTLLEGLSLPAHQLLTAGTAKENVISSDAWTGSLFTDSFIVGAKGQANIYSGVVTLWSLIDFIRSRVNIEKRAANWSASLTPQLRDLRAGDGLFFFPQQALCSELTRFFDHRSNARGERDAQRQYWIRH